MKFVMSYSCGKDSTYALHQFIEAGNEPVGLLIMVNEAMERSWFHGADYALMEKISKALDIPLILCKTQGETYHTALEEGLRKAKEYGAEAACFGDIDIEANRQWCVDRCEAVGMEAHFPLWQHGRKEIVHEIIENGYCCIIKSIHNKKLPKEILGRRLDMDVVKIMEENGIDICGENGEYHTLAVDGPIFKNKLQYELGDVLDFGDISVIDIR